LFNVHIDICDSKITGNCDLFGWFKENREEQKWRRKENNG
jgi:hypothetical protein